MVRKILEENFDFLIMHGWTAIELLQGKVVDAFINGINDGNE